MYLLYNIRCRPTMSTYDRIDFQRKYLGMSTNQAERPPGLDPHWDLNTEKQDLKNWKCKLIAAMSININLTELQYHLKIRLS